MITREALSSMVGCGIGMCSLACVFDASTAPANYPKIADRGYPDVFAVPDWGSWHFARWSGSDTKSSVRTISSNELFPYERLFNRQLSI